MTTTPSRIRLEILDIAEPCPADWSAMSFVDDRTRFCRHCSKNVFDLSAMTRDSAERFVGDRWDAGESVCVRIFRRADGTVVSADCRGRWRAAAGRRVARGIAALSAVVSMVFVMIGCRSSNDRPAKPEPEPRVLTGVIAPPVTTMPVERSE